MIEFLTTPIGIWTALVALTITGVLVGAALSFANFLFGESLAFYSASATGVVALFGIVPALYFSGFAQAALMILIIIGAIALALGLLALMLSPQHGRGLPF